MRPDKPDTHFDDANDALLTSLRDALRPELLRPALANRIRADWERRAMPAARFRLPALHIVGLAAAACLMVALLLPTARTRQPVAPVALSSDEAAAIVAAYGVLAWEGPMDGSLDVISASLEEIERTLGQNSESETSLPWDNEDNWDVPVSTEDGALQSWTPWRGSVPRRA